MVINENSILYFSGTGNTYEMTEKAAGKSGHELILDSGKKITDVILLKSMIIYKSVLD